ncbi:MAG: hypothetical protein IBX69_11565 [Anaerolineales bacterium]|nr:hypothetical protein [Anaerolineales bacterium]
MLSKISPVWLSFLVVAVVFSGLLSACSSSADGQSEHGLKLAPLNEMPVEVRNAPAAVREAYQFAAANPDILKSIPCYCGCGPMGHESNYACYVSEVQADGTVLFDGHSLGCSICVDITQDTMRLLQEGKSVAEIKEFVDQTYSRFGPSNMP